MKKRILIILPCLLILLAAALVLCNDGSRTALREYLQYPNLPKNPQQGKWYSVASDAHAADGSPVRARLRFGESDKLILYFLGGGVVLDEYSASQSYSSAAAKAFYYDSDLNVSARRIHTGIASDAEQNPFRDWTILVVPYATGDFHIGSGGIHRGYDNFTAIMDQVRLKLGKPEQLLITGYSAGGFGAAMLAEDILKSFPETENTVLCVDSALLLHPDWMAVAQNLWHAPEHITARIQSNNLTLDHLEDLHQKYPQLKILFASSIRDGGLAKFQSYINGGAYKTTSEGGMEYQENLCATLERMQKSIPDARVYLWDDARDDAPTGHTMLYSEGFYRPQSGEIAPAQWILNAFNGETVNLGLDLLQCLQ